MGALGVSSEARVRATQRLGCRVGVLFTKVGEEDVLSGADRARDRLADGSCPDDDDDVAHGDSRRTPLPLGALPRYCSSLTFSSHSTALPSSDS